MFVSAIAIYFQCLNVFCFLVVIAAVAEQIVLSQAS